MAHYRIELTRAARRDLRGLEAAIRRRIDQSILGLAERVRPRGVEKLSGSKDLYRVRVGAYRILYRIEDDKVLIVVIRIGHRREIYRRRR